MTGSDEVELKLQLAAADVGVLLAAPLFAGRAPVSQEQVSTYFDTKACALKAAGLSLRIRAVDGERIQTIKTESRSTASLFARGEWERAVDGDVPMLDDVPPLFAERALRDGPALAPVFEARVTRTKVIHESGADRIELVADLGRVVAGGAESPIAEVELELLDGSRESLFDLAHRIAETVPVRIGVQSKSERGYALLAGRQSLSVKAEPIALVDDDDAAALFEAVAGACLRQFRLNEDKLLATGAPASLHQARVGLRRLRSALSVFKKMLAGPEFDRFQRELRALAATLGKVRDVDVMIEKIEHEPALDRLRAVRAERYAVVVATLDSPAVRRLMLDFVEWLSVGDWRTSEETRERREAPAVLAAARILDRLRRRMKHGGKHLARLDDHDRHRVRIVGKKLRYSAEFFADLYRGKKAVRRRDAFLEAIEDLQKALGHLNDLASGRALFEEIGIADADAILATGRKADAKRLLQKAEKAHRELIDVKRFWR